MKPQNVGRYVIAAALILIGLAFLSDNLLQTNAADSFWSLWPLVPLAIGAELLIRAILAERASTLGSPAATFRIEPAVVLITIAVVLVGFVGTLARPAGMSGLTLTDIVDINLSRDWIKQAKVIGEEIPMTPAIRGVTVTNPMGQVIVQPGTEDKVVVEADVNGHGHTTELAQKAIEETKVDAVVSGGQVQVTVTVPRPSESSSAWIRIDNYRSNPADVTLTLSVPEGLDVTVNSSFGKVDVTTGRDVKVTNQFGATTVTGATGDVTVTNDFGETTIKDVAGKVTVKGSSGKVSVTEAKGAVDIQSSFGSLELVDVAGKVDARTSNGSVLIERPGGDVSARTSFGKIEIVDSKGAVSAHTSNGSVEVRTEYSVVADYDIDTSFGSVQLSFPRDSKVTIHARTQFGAINSDLGGSLSKDDTGQTYDAKVSGGGSLIQLETTNGSIEIDGH
ncbi:MAG: hypothetical protein ACYC53_10085 [Bacillota bacterium]